MDVKKLCDILIEMKNDVLLNGSDPQKPAEKYGILFIGSKYEFDTAELLFYLNNSLGIKISLDELHDIIPSACKSLGMTYAPVADLSSVFDGTRRLRSYSISLM